MSVDDSAADPAAHYDKVTEAWAYLLGDNLHYGYFDTGDEPLEQATLRLTQRMAELCAPAAGERILDVGCGTGEPARYLAATFGCHVTGISPSQVCIEQAHAASQGAQQVAFELGDAMEMDYPDASFDGLWVMESSHLMPDKARLISECSRLLKPGGRLVLCDIIQKQRLPLSEVIRYRDDFLLLHDVFGRARMETLEFYAGECESGGLNVTHCEDITAPTRPTFARWRDNAVSHEQQILEHLERDDYSRFVDSCRVLETFWDAGILGYGLLAATRPGN